MIAKILAVVRTSEFWTFIAQVTIEAVGAPVPDEFKAAGWVYIIARIASKVAKKFIPA